MIKTRNSEVSYRQGWHGENMLVQVSGRRDASFNDLCCCADDDADAVKEKRQEPRREMACSVGRLPTDPTEKCHIQT